ncbi:unnamed protein product [Mytilus edulis]|uniref:Uncharacterized protein n=1 Tax=Mytilus edulis TaxID=6550 RepID=A0A8S3TNQ0_MYTED|nr:unnamed protein product [Mytilus edulis]
MDRAEYLKSKSDFGDIFSILAKSGDNSNSPSSVDDYSTTPSETGDAYSFGWDNPSSRSGEQQNISPNEAEDYNRLKVTLALFIQTLMRRSKARYRILVDRILIRHLYIQISIHLDHLMPKLHVKRVAENGNPSALLVPSASYGGALSSALQKQTASDEPITASTGTLEKHHSTSATSYKNPSETMQSSDIVANDPYNSESNAVQQENNGGSEESSVNHGPQPDDSKPNQTINGDTLHTFKDPFDGSSIDANDYILSNMISVTSFQF